MTVYEVAMLAVAVIGVLLTVGTILVTGTRAVARIEISTDAKLTLLRVELDRRFQTQDEVYREVAQGLRKFIELIEAEMHQIELWGRDHYVLKDDHTAALAEVRSDIRTLAKDIKIDFKEIRDDIRNIGKDKTVQK